MKHIHDFKIPLGGHVGVCACGQKKIYHTYAQVIKENPIVLVKDLYLEHRIMQLSDREFLNSKLRLY
jgi:hypothetical protein